MDNMDLRSRNVGDIVADRFVTAQVFKRYGIDFCCHGNVALAEACAAAGTDVEEVMEALQKAETVSAGTGIPFAEWPLDLLMDYVLKIHHRGIRSKGPELLKLIDKVKRVHGEAHPELHELYDLVSVSLEDLEMHLQKEENVLFPYLYDLFQASQSGHTIGNMHCGTIANPIRVMHMEHENEGNRYLHIRELTGGFQVPADACGSYRLMMAELEAFVDALFEHIHLENNIIFPSFMELEGKWVG